MKQMALGKYPDVSLAAARQRHAQARQLLANGVDPMAIRKEEKEQRKVELAQAAVEQPKDLTFETLTRQWFKWWKEDKNPRYARNVEKRLEIRARTDRVATRPHEAGQSVRSIQICEVFRTTYKDDAGLGCCS
jgi:hypothetical protein